MQQWHISGESPIDKASHNSSTELLTPNSDMTVPIQRGSMAILPSRSRFMITDILGSGGNVSAGVHITGNMENVRSSSPQGPRDLTTNANTNHYLHLHHSESQREHDDSDSDLSGQLDDNSSNGKCRSNADCRSFFTFYVP